MPADVKPRVLETAVDLEDRTASLDLALSVASYFELGAQDARAISAEVGRAVSQWREVAAGLGLERPEIERMSSAFAHEDLRKALAG